MSTSHKARFKDEAEIIAVIDRYHGDIADLTLKIASKEELAKALRNTEESHRIPHLRDLIERLQSQIDWRKQQLVSLGERLAEMQTIPLPGSGIDNTVPGL